ncbi:MAG: cation diffusion facilitator family transporter [Myxococcales bacterium]|nr:cation diffusion facilitator family transporter [Myxococcales bacterium]
MAQGGSTAAVVAAIIGNFLVMCAKYVAFGFTDSGTMLGEAIHSTADVFNQLLLMIGIWASGRGATQAHPYGYQPDRFIWAMISAVGVFFIGCGVTLYHGIDALIHPVAVTHLLWAYAVLGVSLALEGSVMLIALRGLKKAAADRPFMEFLRTEADPTAVAVLLEDSVAVLGVLVAMAAIGLTQITENPVFDGIGSIIIGLLLGAVAVILVAQNRRLLIGTAVPERVQGAVMRILDEHPAVEAVYDFKSRMLSVDSYRVKMEVEFDGKTIARRLERLMQAGYPAESYEQFREFCEEFANEVIDALGDEIDAIEEQIRKKVPGVKHVDIEAD